MVCANVSVSKGEGVVNGKNTLIAAGSNAPSQGLETGARAEPHRITFGGNVTPLRIALLTPADLSCVSDNSLNNIDNRLETCGKWALA